MIDNKNIILPIIVVAQFLCTSLWFAGNAATPDLIEILDLKESDLGYITSSVQLGFIIGTLFYAFFTIADRFNPSKVFFVSALLGALSNLLIIIDGIDFSQLLLCRFLTGFFLAGIYPVGMKIASDYFEKGLGKALSFLVGALVLGTALPHLISSLGASFSWKSIIYFTSSLAVFGGFIIWIFVGIGPFRKMGQRPKFAEILRIFSKPSFKSATIGYVGHMWELYAFWAFIPAILIRYDSANSLSLDISLFSFYVISIGGIACIFGGYFSERFGVNKIANYSLALSGLSCLIIPFAFLLSPILFIGFLLFWGMVVIADSPLFSTLVAQNAIPELKGTALTIVTCIGFANTIVSIQLISLLNEYFKQPYVYMVLVIGPIVGLIGQVKYRVSSE